MKFVTIATGLLLFSQVESERILFASDPYLKFPSNTVNPVPTTAPSTGFPSTFGAQGFGQGFGGSSVSSFGQAQPQQFGQQQFGQGFGQQVLPQQFGMPSTQQFGMNSNQQFGQQFGQGMNQQIGQGASQQTAQTQGISLGGGFSLGGLTQKIGLPTGQVNNFLKGQSNYVEGDLNALIGSNNILKG